MYIYIERERDLFLHNIYYVLSLKFLRCVTHSHRVKCPIQIDWNRKEALCRPHSLLICQKRRQHGFSFSMYICYISLLTSLVTALDQFFLRLETEFPKKLSNQLCGERSPHGVSTPWTLSNHLYKMKAIDFASIWRVWPQKVSCCYSRLSPIHGAPFQIAVCELILCKLSKNSANLLILSPVHSWEDCPWTFVRKM